MRVCVYGLWHLGCVTAACLAELGHAVIGVDPDAAVVDGLKEGRAPLFEPRLDALIKKGIDAGLLSFSTQTNGLDKVEVAWVTFDTPIDEDDNPQPQIVEKHVRSLEADLPSDCLVMISSQLPVGTTRQLAKASGKGLSYAYSPENLRLGRAIDVFMKPDRIVVGVAREADKQNIRALLSSLGEQRLLFMSIEDAEMTKHAINAFLATSVVFMNEIATICEQVGADAKAVERGLKSEARIGPGAYLSPGGAFAGGTLARDIATLRAFSQQHGLSSPLINAVRDSNEQHRMWAWRKLVERLGGLNGKRIALLGLTYKPQTSTLRGSSAVLLGQKLQGEGASVVCYDPAVQELPAELSTTMTLAASALEAITGSDALVVGTKWPAFRELPWATALSRMRCPIVVDAEGFLGDPLRETLGPNYASVGMAVPPT